MISKLPRWAWIGAPMLTFSAGIVNAVGFLGFKHHGITHLTGTTTLTGIALGSGDTRAAIHLATLIFAFLVGATFSGAFIQDSTLQLGRRYGIALIIETGLLLAAVQLLKKEYTAGEYFASAACGLQNAMVSTYSGAILRTTHVSGVFTDLGIFLGHLIRGAEVDWRRFRLWAALIGSFMGGGVAAAVAFPSIGYNALYVPAIICITIGMSYAVYFRIKLYAQARRNRPAPEFIER
jgi:uncharacterized membrane protein YoaK (UPF0700 family)